MSDQPWHDAGAFVGKIHPRPRRLHAANLGSRTMAGSGRTDYILFLEFDDGQVANVSIGDIDKATGFLKQMTYRLNDYRHPPSHDRR